MATSEERRRILKLLEDGKLTPEQAAQLLTALGDAAQAKQERKTADGASGTQTGRKAKNVRIRVVNHRSGRANSNVDIVVPVGLVGIIARFTSKTGGRVNVDGVDIDAVWQAIQNGATGRIVDVTGDNGERVEITVD
jgi:hypothetical protein